jgi:hypothetical protein
MSVTYTRRDGVTAIAAGKVSPVWAPTIVAAAATCPVAPGAYSNTADLPLSVTYTID